MTPAPPRRASRSGDAEDLAIRFVNTVAWRLRDPVEERMATPEAMLAWLRRNGLADAGTLDTVAATWRLHPDTAYAAHRTAIRLREAIYALFIGRIRGEAPPNDALAIFNGFLARPGAIPRIGWASGGLVWQLPAGSSDGAGLLAPVALSAADLMTGTRAGKIRQCQDDRGCGWLFVDESRARNRRWCSMGDCGNRAKAQRHYKRTRRHPVADGE